jgi:hypothetical protein
LKIIILVRNIENTREIYGEQFEKLKVIYGDIIQPVHSRGEVDYILNCAIITTSKTIVERPVDTIMTSIEETKNILEFAK